VQSLHDVPAPAKLNLFLHVVGRRADGYHLLQTVFRFVDLCDLLHFERTPDGRVVREGDGLAGLSPDDDLVVRAARALRVATGARYGVRIRYEKRIPAGGGLGAAPVTRLPPWWLSIACGELDCGARNWAGWRSPSVLTSRYLCSGSRPSPRASVRS